MKRLMNAILRRGYRGEPQGLPQPRKRHRVDWTVPQRGQRAGSWQHRGKIRQARKVESRQRIKQIRVPKIVRTLIRWNTDVLTSSLCANLPTGLAGLAGGHANRLGRTSRTVNLWSVKSQCCLGAALCILFITAKGCYQGAVCRASSAGPGFPGSATGLAPGFWQRPCRSAVRGRRAGPWSFPVPRRH